MSDTPQTEDTMVAALLRERAGYAGRKDMQDRVDAVDEQLRLRGYGPDGERIAKDSAPAEDRAPATGPETGPAGTPEADPEAATPQAVAVPAQRTVPPKGRQARGTDKA
ncbi:hypothetical protein G9272_16920 [Streptomyces asoensis]|uniref:Uncharacterized protein n=1 Tax=Streptomyces asoensis TaxID=249586 RepID=A0A6M4WEB3_9ACTN|nr:hypothetical protein [Streptomyces asoensis]QJS98909.1 hypothetical protein G9272_16920 [Streptomyces asoensis]